LGSSTRSWKERLPAKAAGLAIKINAVALKGTNEDEFDALVAWCGEHGFDLCLIETMPMGDIDGDRTDQYLPLSMVRAKLRKTWTLEDTDYKTGGPARYYTVAETGRRIGFITPMTHNFCESCNRVRLTCTGTLYMCLGQDDSADFRRVLRDGASDGGPAPEPHFKREVAETFLRCVKEGISHDNVVIELNALKIAEDKTFADCARWAPECMNRLP
jgi:molybdenum cofactor biosynthesis enzyme MoaA